MPHNEPSKSYPTSDLLHRDPRMARLLFRAYYDELNALSTYTYNSIILAELRPAVASLFTALSMTEMRHFRLLGESIRHLGGNPSIRTDLRILSFEPCPDTAHVHTDSVCRQMIRNAIAAEQTSAWEYRALAAKTRDDGLKQILCRLAADEEEHACMLQQLGIHG
jgi:rubrerythrin